MQVKYGIAAGAVYLIEQDGDKNEHYFVVLNLNPKKDERIILVNATTKYQKENDYVVRRKFGLDTLVYIQTGDSKVITRESTFNCNSYIDPTLEEMCTSLKFKRLEYTGHKIEKKILEELREATLKSPRLRKKYEAYLKDGVS